MCELDRCSCWCLQHHRTAELRVLTYPKSAMEICMGHLGHECCCANTDQGPVFCLRFCQVCHCRFSARTPSRMISLSWRCPRRSKIKKSECCLSCAPNILKSWLCSKNLLFFCPLSLSLSLVLGLVLPELALPFSEIAVWLQINLHFSPDMPLPRALLHPLSRDRIQRGLLGQLYPQSGHRHRGHDRWGLCWCTHRRFCCLWSWFFF